MESVQNNELLADLGLQAESLDNQAEYIRSIREGISGKVVQRTVKIFDNRDIVVRILDTTSSNLHRYYRVKKMNRTDSEEMLDTIRLYRQASRVFGGVEKAKEWVKTPLQSLAGDKPEDLFDTFEGRNWVSQTLRKIEFGEFT
ncbi:MAG: antitoxin Xre/MbcA/ParS toxin-binding domain-containing protein [Pseudomonadota bacterium]|nr:antitoxin Xre/MbcA/ParS toxin-binding domain-containing protein [Pseudomonadota bacterium]